MSKKRKQCEAIVKNRGCVSDTMDKYIYCDDCYLEGKECMPDMRYENVDALSLKIASEWLSSHPKKKGDPMISKREAAERNVKAKGRSSISKIYCVRDCPFYGVECNSGDGNGRCLDFCTKWVSDHPEEPINEWTELNINHIPTDLFGKEYQIQFKDGNGSWIECVDWAKGNKKSFIDVFLDNEERSYRIRSTKDSPSPDLYDIRVIEEPTHIERMERYWLNDEDQWISISAYTKGLYMSKWERAGLFAEWFKGRKSSLIPPEKE